MKKQFIKITLTLVMLIVMAVPTQALAANNYSNYSLNLNESNYSDIYDQVMKQFGQVGAQNQATEQAKPNTQTTKATAAAPKNAAAYTPSSSNIGAYEQQVADLVNKERATVGLPALKVNSKLAGVAEKKAEDLRDKGYFSHTSPTYGSPFDMMKQFGISYSSAGENIAKGQKTPSSVMNGWMNSQGHKDNILNSSYTEIGVGYVTDSNGGTYWVQMFIRP
jgi:uncharacterized YkwD family protein